MLNVSDVLSAAQAVAVQVRQLRAEVAINGLHEDRIAAASVYADATVDFLMPASIATESQGVPEHRG